MSPMKPPVYLVFYQSFSHNRDFALPHNAGVALISLCGLQGV